MCVFAFLPPADEIRGENVITPSAAQNKASAEIFLHCPRRAAREPKVSDVTAFALRRSLGSLQDCAGRENCKGQDSIAEMIPAKMRDWAALQQSDATRT